MQKHFIYIALIIAVTLITYFNCIRNGFVYDDWDLVVDGRGRYEERESLLYPFKEAFRWGAYRPLRDISHAIDRLIWGEDPMGHHITSILIHALSSVVVYGIGFSLFGKRLLALFACLLFATHPIGTESVSWISGRRDILCGLFFFSGIFLLMRYYGAGGWHYLAGVVVCYLLSLSSKEMGVTMPLVLLLYDYLMVGNRKGRERRYAVKYIYLMLFVITVVFSILTMQVSTGQRRAEFHGGSWFPTSLGMVKVFGKYISLLVVPVGQSVEHDVILPQSITEPGVIGWVVAIFCIIAIAILSLRRDRIVSFGIFWFFITLFPVSNVVVPVGNMMAERYLYIPLAGFSLLAVELMRKLKGKRAVSVLSLSLVIFYCFLTHSQNKVWKDDFTLWKAAALVSKASTRPLYNLAVAYAKKDMLDEAVKIYEELIRKRPDHGKYHNNLGDIYAKKGLTEEAKEEFKKAIEFSPDLAVAHRNLALMYQSENRYDDAKAELQESLRLDPEDDVTYFAVGRLFEEEGNLREALRFYAEGVDKNPSNVQAINNIGSVYMKLGRFELAREAFEGALRVDPDFALARDNLRIVEKLTKKTPR